MDLSIIECPSSCQPYNTQTSLQCPTYTIHKLRDFCCNIYITCTWPLDSRGFVQKIMPYLWLYSPCGPCPLFKFLKLCTLGRTPGTGDQPVAWPLPTHRTTQTQNKRTQTSMSRVGFEPTIPAYERAKMIHALDCVATVIGLGSLNIGGKLYFICSKTIAICSSETSIPIYQTARFITRKTRKSRTFLFLYTSLWVRSPHLQSSPTRT
jgi:hypothetical protein